MRLCVLSHFFRFFSCARIIAMKVYFLDTTLTNCSNPNAEHFVKYCRTELDKYIASSVCNIVKDIDCKVQKDTIDKNSILCFCVGEKEYLESVQSFMQSALDNSATIYPIALDKEHRMPGNPVSDKQSFDVPAYLEKRQWEANNMQAVAQIFARKIIGQFFPNIYKDKVKYFISHRRYDGEELAREIAEKLRVMTFDNHTVYRDVAWVESGDEAQKSIDANLRTSDVLIFLHTADCTNSVEVFKELNFAMVHEIPVLWIQIDNADIKKLPFCPGERPHLSYSISEIRNKRKISSICDEIDRSCFELLMSSSKNIWSFIDSLTDMNGNNDVSVKRYKDNPYQYIVQYKAYTADHYDNGMRKHFVQFFARKIEESDAKTIQKEPGDVVDCSVLLTKNCMRANLENAYLTCWKDNFADYMDNIKRNIQYSQDNKGRGIIVISGAFPDCDEIYKPSLSEAVMIYAKEILRNGYILSFGSHPTFQRALLAIGEQYGFTNEQCIHMHMAEEYWKNYSADDQKMFREKCNLKISHNLQAMRECMIGEKNVVAMICLGGKIKKEKNEQGVDIEVGLAGRHHVPVYLVGTVGGRSAQMSGEYEQSGRWEQLNSLGDAFNEKLAHTINHHEMAQKLLRKISEGRGQS